MYYLYVKNGRFVTVIVSHRGVCFADICPRPHRVSVDTGQASRCPLKRPVTVRLEVSQKPYFSYYFVHVIDGVWDFRIYLLSMI